MNRQSADVFFSISRPFPIFECQRPIHLFILEIHWSPFLITHFIRPWRNLSFDSHSKAACKTGESNRGVGGAICSNFHWDVSVPFSDYIHAELDRRMDNSTNQLFFHVLPSYAECTLRSHDSHKLPPSQCLENKQAHSMRGGPPSECLPSSNDHPPSLAQSDRAVLAVRLGVPLVAGSCSTSQAVVYPEDLQILTWTDCLRDAASLCVLSLAESTR